MFFFSKLSVTSHQSLDLRKWDPCPSKVTLPIITMFLMFIFVDLHFLYYTCLPVDLYWSILHIQLLFIRVRYSKLTIFSVPLEISFRLVYISYTVFSCMFLYVFKSILFFSYSITLHLCLVIHGLVCDYKISILV